MSRYRYEPDTCKCIVFFRDGGVIGHVADATSITKCPAHAALTDAIAIQSVCGENKNKNFSLDAVQKQFMRRLSVEEKEIVRLVRQHLGDKTPVPDTVPDESRPISWRFDDQRRLKITVGGATSQERQTALATLANDARRLEADVE